MTQLFLACSGADRDPENAMRWLGTSIAHLFTLDSDSGTLTSVGTTAVGCNAMSASQVPRAADADGSSSATATTLVFTDMADPHAVGAGGVALYTASAEDGVKLSSAAEVTFADAGGRSPCAVEVCPLNSVSSAVHLAAVACYEGRGTDADGVVSLVGIERSSSAAPWSFATTSASASWGAPLAVASHADLGGATAGEGRQDAAHPHGVTWWVPGDGAEELILFVADLGANAVVAYAVAASDGSFGLVRRAVCMLHAGAGPRHMVLLGGGVDGSSSATTTLVVVNELDNTIVPITVHRGGAEVTMSAGAALSTLPLDFDMSRAPPFDFYTAPSHACAIVKDGALLYVSNRGDDSVATFSVGGGGGGGADDDEDGAARIALLGHTYTAPGRLPWDLALDRSGKWAAVSSQFDAELSKAGGSVAIFARQGSSALAAMGGGSTGAVCVPNVLLTRFLL